MPLLILLVGLSYFATPAFACSCMALEPQQMLEFGPIAFVGTVSGIGAGVDNKVMTFEVDTVLTGELPGFVDIVTAANGAACGIEAPVGSRVAVFASEEGGRLTSSLCATTDPDTAINALGPGSPPTTSVSEAPFDWPAVWLGAGAVALVAGVWLTIRRFS